jgi:hypothetical protein
VGSADVTVRGGGEETSGDFRGEGFAGFVIKRGGLSGIKEGKACHFDWEGVDLSGGEIVVMGW